MARWETDTRWYEAVVTRDLFGGWMICRTWGRKRSARFGHLNESVPSEEAAQARLLVLHKHRLRRSYQQTREEP